MVSLFKVAQELQEFFRQEEIPFCFIGGIAVLRWGEIRTTNDVDLTVLCGFGNEEQLAVKILKKFSSRIQHPIEFCLQNRVLLLYAENNIPIDISFSGLNYEEQMIKNSSLSEIYPGVKINTCSAEDLIIMKAFANRPKDISDIQGIISRQSSKLDSKYIFSNLAPLAEMKQNAAIITNLKQLFNI